MTAGRAVAALSLAMATALSGCLDGVFEDDQRPEFDEGRAEISAGDWLASGIEVYEEWGVPFEVQVERGPGIDPFVLTETEYLQWMDGEDVQQECGLVDTRLWEQSCVLEQGNYALVLYNPHAEPVTVSYRWG